MIPLRDNQNRRIVLIGASSNVERESYTVARLLVEQGFHLLLVGLKAGEVGGIEILTAVPENPGKIDTITLYLSPKNQIRYYDVILRIRPGRVVFNPGTENEDLQRILKENNISFEETCSHVLLRTGRF